MIMTYDWATLGGASPGADRGVINSRRKSSLVSAAIDAALQINVQMNVVQEIALTMIHRLAGKLNGTRK